MGGFPMITIITNEEGIIGAIFSSKEVIYSVEYYYDGTRMRKTHTYTYDLLFCPYEFRIDTRTGELIDPEGKTTGIFPLLERRTHDRTRS
jgi:hypothetical protein